MNHAYTLEQLQALPAGSPVWLHDPFGPGVLLRWWLGGYSPGAGFVRLQVRPGGSEVQQVSAGMSFYPTRLALLRQRLAQANDLLANVRHAYAVAVEEVEKEEVSPTAVESPERVLLRKVRPWLFSPALIGIGDAVELQREIDRLLGVPE